MRDVVDYRGDDLNSAVISPGRSATRGCSTDVVTSAEHGV